MPFVSWLISKNKFMIEQFLTILCPYFVPKNIHKIFFQQPHNFSK